MTPTSDNLRGECNISTTESQFPRLNERSIWMIRTFVVKMSDFDQLKLIAMMQIQTGLLSPQLLEGKPSLTVVLIRSRVVLETDRRCVSVIPEGLDDITALLIHHHCRQEDLKMKYPYMTFRPESDKKSLLIFSVQTSCSR